MLKNIKIGMVLRLLSSYVITSLARDTFILIAACLFSPLKCYFHCQFSFLANEFPLLLICQQTEIINYEVRLY